MDVQLNSYNGYGTPLGADVTYTPAVEVNAAVMQKAKSTQINTDGIFGSSLAGKVMNTVRMLKAADQVILGVQITSVNGYGKPLSAVIQHISSFVYDTIIPPAQK